MWLVCRRIGFLFTVLLLMLTQSVQGQDVQVKKEEIFRKLRDRRCETMTIEQCQCPDAKEMRSYIEGLIAAGTNQEDIYYKVAQKYSLKAILDDQIKQVVEKRIFAESGGKIPSIELETGTINLGTISKKKGLWSKSVKISNNGSAPLVIKNLRVSCTCVTVALKKNKKASAYFGTAGAPAGWQEVLAAGESARLDVLFDLKHSSMTVGRQNREVFIETNDPRVAQVSVKFTLDVVE